MRLLMTKGLRGAWRWSRWPGGQRRWGGGGFEEYVEVGADEAVV